VFKILKSRKDLTDDDIPLRIFSSPLCGRCQEIKGHLTRAGVAWVDAPTSPTGILRGGLDRFHAATLLAVFTAQDELLPAIIGQDWESCVWQQDIERFVK